MGSSASASLTFGIDLGDEIPASLNPDEEDDFDFDHLITKEAGLPEWRNDMSDEECHEHFAKEREVIANAPVELVCHGYEFDSYILAIPGYHHRVEWCETKEITPAVINNLPSVDELVKFKEWCRNHDIEDAQPSWLLSAMWG